MAGLAVIELLEEVGSELGVFSNEGVELMVGQCWGVDGWVGVSQHCSAVEGAEGVSTKGGVGLAVFEQRLLSGFAALGSLLRFQWFGGAIIIEVPHWGQEVPVESRGVGGIITTGLVGWGSQDGRYFFL